MRVKATQSTPVTRRHKIQNQILWLMDMVWKREEYADVAAFEMPRMLTGKAKPSDGELLAALAEFEKESK